MKSYEFSRFFHPKLGRFVYRHKGTGLIVDNIFKPMSAVASTLFKKFAKPVAKKALQSGISHAGEKLGKKAVEKSGDLIMKKTGKYEQSETASPISPSSSEAWRKATSGRKFCRNIEQADLWTGSEASWEGVKRNKRI